MPEMPNTSEILLARLAEGLDSTAKMTQALLSDLRESEADFAAIKTEVNIIKENVKGLSELVRDGGTSAILTRVALVEQSIKNIQQWLDNHVDVHQRLKKDFSEIRNQLSEIERRLSAVENTLRQLQDEEKERARERRVSIDRELDLVHEQKKNDDKIRSEWRSTFVKIVAAVVIGTVGLVGGYLANSCTVAAGQPDSTEAPAKVTSPFPASPDSARTP
jgi:NurA-like 5'-3' nuclease